MLWLYAYRAHQEFLGGKLQAKHGIILRNSLAWVLDKQMSSATVGPGHWQEIILRVVLGQISRAEA